MTPSHGKHSTILILDKLYQNRVDSVAPDRPPAPYPDGASVVVVGHDRPARSDDLEITVSDGGCGIPAIVLASVFEPFFTTKPIGMGTGLGLAMVRGFVEAASGSLEVSSTVEVGTTFTIRLPRSQAAAA